MSRMGCSKKRWSIVIAATMVLAFGFVSGADAMPISMMIGDNDGFGFGAAAVPDDGDLLNINLPEDRRDAAEAAAANGAQQTDFYSANFNPLSETFDVIFPLAAPLLSATFEVDMGGFQASTFGQFGVSYNGVSQPNVWNFQDGAFATAVRQFVLSPDAIANANLAGEFRVGISRGNSNDAVAFDYFKLTGEQVPEPTTLVLLGTGLVLLGLSRRRRRA